MRSGGIDEVGSFAIDIDVCWLVDRFRVIGRWTSHQRRWSGSKR